VEIGCPIGANPCQALPRLPLYRSVRSVLLPWQRGAGLVSSISARFHRCPEIM
jgi:hypothetical protein